MKFLHQSDVRLEPRKSHPKTALVSSIQRDLSRIYMDIEYVDLYYLDLCGFIEAK